MTLTIDLVERGQPGIITLHDWAVFGLEKPMRSVAAQGIVRLTRSPAGMLVTPGHHVGEMRISGAVLRVSPKSPELFLAMEKLAIEASFRRAREFDPMFKGVAGDDRDPAGAFLRSLLACVRAGFSWDYFTNTQTTSFPKGKIEFGATIKSLASRGIRHRVVCSNPIRKQNADLVRVVRAAAACLSAVPGVTPSLLAQVEALLCAVDSAPQFTSLREAVLIARSITERSLVASDGLTAELARRSLQLLSGEYEAAGLLHPVPGGVARFKDLEELWERCVLRLVERTPSVSRDAEIRFHGFRGSNLRLFANGGPELDPDIVTFASGQATAVVDAKYKRLESGRSAVAGDLYQISSYVRRSAAAIGLLIYFSEQDAQLEMVGNTPEGAPVLAVSVSSEVLLSEGENSLESLLASNGLSQAVKDSIANRARYQRSNGIADLPGDILLRA